MKQKIDGKLFNLNIFVVSFQGGDCELKGFLLCFGFIFSPRIGDPGAPCMAKKLLSWVTRKPFLLTFAPRPPRPHPIGPLSKPFTVEKGNHSYCLKLRYRVQSDFLNCPSPPPVQCLNEKIQPGLLFTKIFWLAFYFVLNEQGAQ